MDTKEHDIEAVAAKQTIDDSPQPQRKPWYTLFLSPLWLCLLIALMLRVWLVIHTHGVIDGDEALLGIQAEHILHGEVPIYFYGQAYMGSLEAYLVALLFAITGPSVWTLRTEPMLLSLVVVCLTWKLAGALARTAQLPAYAQQIFMTIAACLAAIPPLYDTVVEMRLLGGYIETFVLMLLLLVMVLHLTLRWHAGVSSKELALRWAGIGFIVGVGCWVDPLFLSAVLAAALWIAGYCIGEIVKRSKQMIPQRSVSAALRPARKLLLAVVAVPTCIIGLTPALLWGATHQWKNVSYIQSLGGGLSRHRLAIILHVTRDYGTCVAPRIIGGAPPTEDTMLTALHWPLIIFSTFCIGVTVALIIISFFWHHPLLLQIRLFATLPTLFAFCTAFVYCTSSASVFVLLGCNLDDTGRYATPLMLALPFFFASVFTAFSMYMHERGKRQARNVNAEKRVSGRLFFAAISHIPSAGQVLLVLLLLIYLGTHVWTYIQSNAAYTFQSTYCLADPANNDPIIAYMQREHIRYFWASNLLAYPIVFKTNSSIIGADARPLLHPRESINRIPSYTDAILHADRPSMLVLINHNDPHPLLLRLLDARNVTYHAAVFPSEPGFDVLVVTPVSRTVSPLEKGFDIFNCSP